MIVMIVNTPSIVFYLFKIFKNICNAAKQTVNNSSINAIMLLIESVRHDVENHSEFNRFVLNYCFWFVVLYSEFF